MAKKKTKAEMDREYWDRRDKQKKLEHKEATKHKVTMYKKGRNVTRRDDVALTPKQLRDAQKEIKAHKKGELKNKPYKRKYTQEVKEKPKYGKHAKSPQEKKIKVTKRKDSKKKMGYITKEGITYKKKAPDAPVKKRAKPKFKYPGMGS